MNMPSSATATVGFSPNSRSSSQSRGCRKRIGIGSSSTNTRVNNSNGRPTTKKTAAAKAASLSDAQQQRRQQRRDHFSGGAEKKVTTATTPTTGLAAAVVAVAAGNDNANDSDEDNNSYLLPRTLFQDPSRTTSCPPSASSCSPSNNRNQRLSKLIADRRTDNTEPNKQYCYPIKQYSELEGFQNDSPNEVGAVTAVTPPLSASTSSSSSKKGCYHQPSEHDAAAANNSDSADAIDDDQESIVSELSNLSTPSENHRRIIHNSHKLARHILLHNSSSDGTSIATTTETTTAETTTTETTTTTEAIKRTLSKSPKGSSVKNPSSLSPDAAAAKIVPITPTTTKGISVPLKHDPEFSLYFRMLRYGFTMNAVRAALRKDGKPDITRLDPERPVDRQRMPRVPPSSSSSSPTTTTGKEIIVNEHGLTDRGWEMALESARKALDRTITTMNNNKNIICSSSSSTTTTRTAQDDNKSSSAADTSNSTSSSRKATNATTNTTIISSFRDHSNDAAVGNSPPWLLLHHKTIAAATPKAVATATNAAEHDCVRNNNSGVVLEGWLHKRTRRGRWVKRWYLMDSSGIYYTHSPPPPPPTTTTTSSRPPPSSSSSSSSSRITMIKYTKLVDSRYLLLCTKNIRSPNNPTEFELCRHPSTSTTTPSSGKHVLATLKASSVAEAKMWMDAMDCVCERQRLADEAVIGSSATTTTTTKAVMVPEASNNAIAPKSKEHAGGHRNGAKTRIDNRERPCVCTLDRSSSSSTTTTTTTTTNHTRTQPKLLPSRDTLDTLASSSDDSLDVFEERCNDNTIPRQRSPIKKNDDCQSKFHEEFGNDDLMKAVDDLTRLNTFQEGRKRPGEPSTPPDSMDVDDNHAKLVEIGAENEMKQDGSKRLADDEPMLKSDPKYQKYFAMMKMGLPKQVAQHAMKRDQLDPSILDLDLEKSLRSQLTSHESKCIDDVDLPLKDDPRYSKYFKMLKMGLPKDAAKHAMKRDQLDSSILDLNPEKSLNSQIRPDACVAIEIGLPLKEDPKYATYFHMMKIGLPKDVAQHAMLRDRLDPQILNMDPERSLASQSGPTAPPSTTAKAGQQFQPTGEMRGAKTAKATPKLRRKKVYWNRVDAREGNIWSAVRKLEPTLKHDPTEFERLFSQSTDAVKEKVQYVAPRSTSPLVKNVKVIDPKRGMNGDIILRKLKLTPSQVASMVEHLDCGHLDAAELRTLYEFMPTKEESKGLAVYLENSKSKTNSVLDLTPCEQFMVAMKDLEDSEKKFQSMIFISEFQGKMAELKWDAKQLSSACDELRTSKRFKMLLAMILMLVNKINSSGEDDDSIAHGFSMDSLSKLCETKAFDNRTSVLHYLVRVIRESNKDILKFPEDIKSVVLAKNVVMERLVTTVKQLCEDSRKVAETAAKYGEGYRRSMKYPHQKEKFRIVNESAKEMRQMVTLLSDKDVPSGNNNYTHCERFAMFSKLELQKALGVIKEANQNYIDLLQYFGEDMKSPQAFFGVIDQFMDRFDQVADLIETEEQASRKITRQALAKEAKLRVKAAFKSALDGESVVNALKEVDDNGISSGGEIRSILRGIPKPNMDYPDIESAPAIKTTRPSNNAIRAGESVAVPYDEEVSGGVGIRKSSTLGWMNNQNTAIESQPPGHIMPTTVTNETIFRSTRPIPPDVTNGATISVWRQPKVGAHHPTGLPRTTSNIGSTSIADITAAAACKSNNQMKLNAEIKPTQSVGKVTAARQVKDSSKMTQNGEVDPNTRHEKYLLSYQKKHHLHQEGAVQKKSVGRIQQAKLAQEEARYLEQRKEKVGVINAEPVKQGLTPSLVAQPPTISIDSQAAAMRKDKRELCDLTKNLNQNLLPRLVSPESHSAHSPQEVTCGKSSAVTHQRSQAEVAVSAIEKMKERGPLQAKERRAQPTNTISTLIALREAVHSPDTNPTTAAKQKIKQKAHEEATFPSVPSPTAMNIATKAAEVIQKKDEQWSEQNKKDLVCIGVESSSQAKTWAATKQNDTETCLLLTETERLKRTLVDANEVILPTKLRLRSSSATIQCPDASFNYLVTINPCRSPPPLPVERKPSKLSIAVAAAAQNRSGTNYALQNISFCKARQGQ